MKVKKAVIPAAGLGTRMLPAAKSIPKEMITVVDRPAIHYIVDEIINSGITDILIITARDKMPIEDYFDRSYELEDKLLKSGKERQLGEMKRIAQMADLFYIRQGDSLGLGHAVLKAKEFVGAEPFALLLGDDIVYNEGPAATSQLCEAYEEAGMSILGVQRTKKEELCRYGNILVEKMQGRLMQVADMVEKPPLGSEMSEFAAMGRYVLSAEVFERLESAQPDSSGEIQLTTALKALAKEGRLSAYDFEGRRYDTGNKSGYLEAVVEFGLRNEETAESFRKYLKNSAQSWK